MVKKKLDADPDVEIAGDQFVEEFCTKPSFDDDGVQVSSGIGLDGKEYPDPVPMAPPVGFVQPPDLMDMMRSMLRSEQHLRRQDEEGFDTIDEAGDFDVDDDPPPPLTLHEALLMPVPAASPPAATSPPASTAAPQVTAAKEGGEEAGSPKTPAPAAPTAPQNSTST